MHPLRVVLIAGTRPEAIKLAPVHRELSARAGEFEPVLVATSQHMRLLRQALDAFDLRPDVDMQLMKDNQGPDEFLARALPSLTALFDELQPAVVLVQGDTTTVLAAALGAFYKGIAVGHVEAGLRTLDPASPFPEEMHRRLLARLATFHFAPTAGARHNLLHEGVPADRVALTGNTIVDAVGLLKPDDDFEDPGLWDVDFDTQRVILVTAHRRENHGAGIREICAAVRRIVSRHPDVAVVVPVHPNPGVHAAMHGELGSVKRVLLLDSLSYGDLIRTLRRCWLVATDSGGLQEEAPSFRKPVLVLRSTTERPELIESGAGVLVGADANAIVAQVDRLRADEALYAAMTSAPNPFGDGHAARRIVDVLRHYALFRRGHHRAGTQALRAG